MLVTIMMLLFPPCRRCPCLCSDAVLCSCEEALAGIILHRPPSLWFARGTAGSRGGPGARGRGPGGGGGDTKGGGGGGGGPEPESIYACARACACVCACVCVYVFVHGVYACMHACTSVSMCFLMYVLCIYISYNIYIYTMCR